MKRHTLALKIVIIAGITGFSAYFVAGEPALFSHKAHIEEYGAECAGCHDGAKDPPGIQLKKCADCHEKKIGPMRLIARAKKGSIAFSHQIHNNVAECIDCHKTTAADKQRAGLPIQRYKTCVACHEENGIEIAEGDCARCHRTDLKKTRPESHRKSWMTRHGKQSEWGASKGHGNDCYLCHSRGECKSCHKLMKPKDHTALFRIRTHGRVAGFDRERCRTCHETGACINCHRNSAPMTHRGAWRRVHGLSVGASGKERCMVCHSASFGAAKTCRECHRRSR